MQLFVILCGLVLLFICPRMIASGLGFGISNSLELDTRNKGGHSNIIRLDTRSQGSYEMLSNSLALDTRQPQPGDDVSPDSLSGFRITLASLQLNQDVLCSDTIAHLEFPDAAAVQVDYSFDKDAPNHAWLLITQADIVIIEAELVFLSATSGTAFWWYQGLPDTGYFSLTGPVPDRDLDGMDDAWEQALVDFNPNDAIDSIDDLLPDGDFDGDSETNARELANGTDAANAADTANPGHAFSDFSLAAIRHVEQTSLGFRERGFSLQLTVGALSGKSISRGLWIAPGDSEPKDLPVSQDGLTINYQSSILPAASFPETFPAGTYSIQCELTNGEDTSWLLFGIPFSPTTEAASYPPPVSIVSHPPFADRLAADPPPLFETDTNQWSRAVLSNNYSKSILAVILNPSSGTALQVPDNTLEGLPLYTLDLWVEGPVDGATQTETRFWFATDLPLFPAGWVFTAPPQSQFGQQTLATYLFGADRYHAIAWKQQNNALTGINPQTPLAPDTPVWIQILAPLLYIQQSDSVPDAANLTLSAGWNAVCIPGSAGDVFYAGLPDHPAVEAVYEWNVPRQCFVPPKPADGKRRALWIFANAATVLNL